jgi:D-alanine-D-alanine ligase
MKINLAVIFGGKSSEHDISIITALQALKALDKDVYNIIPIYISKKGNWFSGKGLFDISTFSEFDKKNKNIYAVSLTSGSNYLYKKNIFNKYKKYKILDCVIIAMHGVNGEDGSLQGLMELCNIPYSSSGVVGSSLCMDKVLVKRIFENLKLPVLPWLYVNRDNIDFNEVHEQIKQEINYPVIIKPANLGSSIGINVCNNKTQLTRAILVASEYDKKIIIEKCVTNLKEINCAVLGYKKNVKTSSLEEPVNYKNFLTFEQKYLQPSSKSSKGGMSNLKRILPAKLTKDETRKIKDMSLKVFKELECSGVVRIDFIKDKTSKQIYINEVNTIPGSFAFYLFEYDKLSFTKLLDELVESALLKHKEKLKNKYTYTSSVVLNFSGSKGGSK